MIAYLYSLIYVPLRFIHALDMLQMMYTTTEQKMRINGILSLCKKRSYLDESNDHLIKGIACLENVIQILNQCGSR